MTKVVVFGNSGAGKSTLANRYKNEKGLAHLDLDTVAWKDCLPPERRPLIESQKDIEEFMATNDQWVVEGCYSDLLEIAIQQSTEIIFLNLPISECIANAKKRPWEPHKYESKTAQDANLNMLIDWISQYEVRDDAFSKSAHEALFSRFDGKKIMFLVNE